MKRRSDDHKNGMSPWLQFALSMLGAAIIGISSGYVSSHISLAVHAEQIKDIKERFIRIEDRLNSHVERKH